MISRAEAAENERKHLRLEEIIWFYQDKHNNARIPLKALAYEFVWRLLKKREVFEVVEILTKLQDANDFRGYALTGEEKKMVGKIYREAIQKIKEEKLD